MASADTSQGQNDTRPGGDTPPAPVTAERDDWKNAAEPLTTITAVRSAFPAHRVPARNDVGQAGEDPVVIDSAAHAKGGDKRAWDALVERYAPLIWSICRTSRLADADAHDVGQSIWMRLVDQLDKIREPAALAGWLATTTRRECGRVVRAAHGPHAVARALDAENVPDEQTGPVEQELLAAERHAALREAFTQLPPEGQQLIAMLVADPPVPYAQISARLGIPVGSIGPTRSRCLDKMRRHPAIAALITAESGTPRAGPGRG